MVSSVQNQSEIGEPFGADWHALKQEIGFLRSIIAELLIKNQNLRWELLGHRGGQAYEGGLMTAPEGTPLCRNSLIAGMP
jgi:hypothetical protein